MLKLRLCQGGTERDMGKQDAEEQVNNKKPCILKLTPEVCAPHGSNRKVLSELGLETQLPSSEWRHICNS